MYNVYILICLFLYGLWELWWIPILLLIFFALFLFLFIVPHSDGINNKIERLGDKPLILYLVACIWMCAWIFYLSSTYSIIVDFFFMHFPPLVIVWWSVICLFIWRCCCYIVGYVCTSQTNTIVHFERILKNMNLWMFDSALNNCFFFCRCYFILDVYVCVYVAHIVLVFVLISIFFFRITFSVAV